MRSDAGERVRPLSLKGGLLAAFVMLALMGIVMIADYLWQLRQSAGQIPPGAEAHVGGAFALIDQNGRTVTERDFSSRHQLIFFGYTHCPDVCPTTLVRVSHILQGLGANADRLHAIFITVDPERDTPALLHRYAQAFDPRIVYLSGSKAAIEQAVTAWRASRAKIAVGGNDYLMEHSVLLYLMSPEGTLLKTYDWDQPLATMERSIRHVIAP